MNKKQTVRDALNFTISMWFSRPQAHRAEGNPCCLSTQWLVIHAHAPLWLHSTPLSSPYAPTVRVRPGLYHPPAPQLRALRPLIDRALPRARQIRQPDTQPCHLPIHTSPIPPCHRTSSTRPSRVNPRFSPLSCPQINS